jgi:basic membrane protein A
MNTFTMHLERIGIGRRVGKLLVWALLGLVAHTPLLMAEEPLSQSSVAQSPVVKSTPLKVGLVLDRGGKDDKSFNAAAVRGIEEAQRQFKIEPKIVEATDDHAFVTQHRNFAHRQYDLIIGVGFAQAEAVKKVATQFPQTKFAIVDMEVPLPNVQSLMFEEHEGSYLVGALAAMKSKTGKIGFIGGMDIPLIRRFERGYEAGAKSMRPAIQLVSHFVGETGAAWNNPPRAKEIALTQFQGGVDIIFGAAGGSNYGLFDAAEEIKKLAIGVDSNQNWIKPGFILTSMLKRVDTAVLEVCRAVRDGKFQGGVKRFGLANGGVDYSIDEHNKKLLNQDDLKKLSQIKSQILSKKIIVPDYYLEKSIQGAVKP